MVAAMFVVVLIGLTVVVVVSVASRIPDPESEVRRKMDVYDEEKQQADLEKRRRRIVPLLKVLLRDTLVEADGFSVYQAMPDPAAGKKHTRLRAEFTKFFGKPFEEVDVEEVRTALEDAIGVEARGFVLMRQGEGRPWFKFEPAKQARRP